MAATMRAMTFHEKLRMLIGRSGARGKELERAVGISDSKLTRWKRGTHEPSLSEAGRLARFFGVPLEYLFDESQAEPASSRLTESERDLIDIARELGTKDVYVTLIRHFPREPKKAAHPIGWKGYGRPPDDPPPVPAAVPVKNGDRED